MATNRISELQAPFGVDNFILIGKYELPVTILGHDISSALDKLETAAGRTGQAQGLDLAARICRERSGVEYAAGNDKVAVELRNIAIRLEREAIKVREANDRTEADKISAALIDYFK